MIFKNLREWAGCFVGVFVMYCEKMVQGITLKVSRLFAGDAFKNNWNAMELRKNKNNLSFPPPSPPRIRFTVPRNVDGHGIFKM